MPDSRNAGGRLRVRGRRCSFPASLRRDSATPSPAPDPTMDIPKDLTTTASGLQYADVAVGAGADAVERSRVSVHYSGELTDGRPFDSSRDRGEPFEFVLGVGQVIRGWDEGVSGMKVGGRRILVIPSELGYGARGAGGVIPPNATLVFDVELLGVR